ncbi:hypothetical protein PPL_02839 [Heterostelium album PN500]|uniref:Uncharacterized protein n=1 Tax=Heterostelium pallidum (strain ATCC 26659 / Pp 5 / PN500) TaxID=670386 RepID=D3B374_HETP5|nr:hypothetical protein PPL_02839 [Heterostelium album PN500]EFA83772.1 hypothetical protein PPL_02839 [Heterostelium album PN500]|eukprot:XP_020435889.1 hypothetical protein PPL_02839 [Heterostelium album PN500]
MNSIKYVHILLFILCLFFKNGNSFGEDILFLDKESSTEPNYIFILLESKDSTEGSAPSIRIYYQSLNDNTNNYIEMDGNTMIGEYSDFSEISMISNDCTVRLYSRENSIIDGSIWRVLLDLQMDGTFQTNGIVSVERSMLVGGESTPLPKYIFQPVQFQNRYNKDEMEIHGLSVVNDRLALASLDNTGLRELGISDYSYIETPMEIDFESIERLPVANDPINRKYVAFITSGIENTKTLVTFDLNDRSLNMFGIPTEISNSNNLLEMKTTLVVGICIFDKTVLLAINNGIDSNETNIVAIDTTTRQADKQTLPYRVTNVIHSRNPRYCSFYSNETETLSIYNIELGTMKETTLTLDQQEGYNIKHFYLSNSFTSPATSIRFNYQHSTIYILTIVILIINLKNILS